MSEKRPLPSAGFTLLELMIVVAIIGIMAALAASMVDGRERHVKDLARQLHSALSFARGSAVGTHQSVLVAVGDERIVVFLDRSSPKDNIYQPGEDKLLRTYPPMSEKIKAGLTVEVISGLPVVGATPTVIFDRDGYSRDATGNFAGGTLEVVESHKHPPKRQRLSITVGGAVRIH